MTRSLASQSAGKCLSDIPEETIDTALQWYLRMKDSSATQDDQDNFEAWLSHSEQHAAAFQYAAQLWDEIKGPATLLYQQHTTANAARTPRMAKHVPYWGLAGTATLIATLLLSFELWREPAHFNRWMADISTAPCQLTQHMLADGSILVLDGNSAIDISINTTTRELSLRRGRFWIDAARQPKPLTIKAGNASIEVLGTNFSVSRFNASTTITVGEGEVLVRDANNRRTTLSAGQQLTVAGGEFSGIQDIDPLLVLAWKEGQIIFDQANINDIVAQLERMRPGRILFDDQAFLQLRLSGSFPANQPDALLSALVSLPTIEARQLPGDLLWLHSADAG